MNVLFQLTFNSRISFILFYNFCPFMCTLYLVLILYFNSVDVVSFGSLNMFRIIDLKSLGEKIKSLLSTIIWAYLGFHQFPLSIGLT